MPPATDATIEAALLARLRTRLRSAEVPGEFIAVERWPGVFSMEVEIDQATYGKAPAALLAYEQTAPEGTNGEVAETILDDGETVVRHAFVVCVIVKDARPDAARSVQGSDGQPGILTAGNAVMKALTGLRIAGMYRDESVRFAGKRAWKAQRGSYIAHLVRFTARVSLDTTDTESVGEVEVEPLELMTGENGPNGATDLDPSTIDLTDP